MAKMMTTTCYEEQAILLAGVLAAILCINVAQAAVPPMNSKGVCLTSKSDVNFAKN